MKNNRKNAFTLIELIAVLVIMAIIAVIVTPLVLNIVKKAKDSANKRSVDAYGKSVELAVATYLLNNEEYPTSLEGLKVEYSGNEVICNVKTLNEDGSIYLSECTVKGTEVKDIKNEDGWYHYGKITSNIVTDYSYKIGDIVTYNGMDFYVIANSPLSSDSVTLLKADPLTVDEVNTYGAGYINKYTASIKGVAENFNGNGYGGMAYYSSSTCGYINRSSITSECTTDYDASDIKYAVDNWAIDKLKDSDLKEDSLGYKVRLITYEELTTNLGYTKVEGITHMNLNTETTPNWVYNEKYYYWTMSAYEDSSFDVWYVRNNGSVGSGDVYGNVQQDYRGIQSIRPVITLLKSAI